MSSLLAGSAFAETQGTPAALDNPGFEADDLGFYGTSDPGFPVMGWRVFAGQANSGLYEFEIVEDASEGDKALRMARQAPLGQGAGGGIDLTRNEIAVDQATSFTVTFDAKLADDQPSEEGSTVLIELKFTPHKERHKVEKVFALTAEYQSFACPDIAIPADTESINVIFRPRDANGERGPANVVIDHIAVSLVGELPAEPGVE